MASSSKLRKQLLRERKLQAQQAESNPSTLATIFNNNAITTGDRPKETDRRRSAKEDYQGFSIDINSASNNPLNISSDDIQTPVSSIAYTDAGMYGNNVNTNFVPVRSHFPANGVGEDNWGARSVDESDLSMSTTNRSYSNNQYGGNSNSRYGVPIQRSTISTIRSLPPKPVAKQRSANSSINTKTTRLPPSSFARDVVQELGVEDEQAEVAMSVVDKISAMTAEQIDKLDYETRQQILQIRKDLGLTSKDNGDAPVPSGRRRSSNSRSASAPRMRPNSQGNSTENSGRLGMVNNEFTAVSAQGKFGNSKSTVASRSNTYNKNNGGVKHEYVDLQFSPNSNTSTLNSSKFDNSYIKIDVDSDDDVGYSQLDDMDF